MGEDKQTQQEDSGSSDTPQVKQSPRPVLTPLVDSKRGEEGDGLSARVMPREGASFLRVRRSGWLRD